MHEGSWNVSFLLPLLQLGKHSLYFEQESRLPLVNFPQTNNMAVSHNQKQAADRRTALSGPFELCKYLISANHTPFVKIHHCSKQPYIKSKELERRLICVCRQWDTWLFDTTNASGKPRFGKPGDCCSKWLKQGRKIAKNGDFQVVIISFRLFTYAARYEGDTYTYP